jgi:Tfp pilus assembly protein PilF
LHRSALSSGLASLLAVAACSGHGAPGAQSPERQSDAEYDLAVDYFHKGQQRVALDHVLKAVELNDENSKALYFASTVYLSFCAGMQGMKSADCRLEDAEKYARLAIKADPQFRDGKNLLGQLLILEKKCKEAIEILEPLTKDPAFEASYLAWGNLGWAQVCADQLDQGIVSLRNAVTQPRFCVGHYRLGVAYEKKNDFAQAEQSLTQAVMVDSPDCQSLQDAWQARARVRLKLGKVTEGRSDLERCRDLAPESQAGKECVSMLAQNPPK